MDDKAYREWIQTLPSCYSGLYSEYVDGEGRCVAAHVRRAVTSGTGYKGEYVCVPLTQVEHLLQHHYGEEYLAPREWWDIQVKYYQELWHGHKNKRQGN